MLYFNSVIAKLMEEEWQNGTAVYYYLNDPMLGLPDALHGLFDFILQSACHHPDLGHAHCANHYVLRFVRSENILASDIVYIHFMHEIFAVMLGLTSFSITVAGILVLFLVPAENSSFEPLQSPLSDTIFQ